MATLPFIGAPFSMSWYPRTLAFSSPGSGVQGEESFWQFVLNYSGEFFRKIKMRNEGRDWLTEEEVLASIMISDGLLR